ncbi:MAG: heavy-metal-associated domain-containing protein [Vulcanimicrobiaceae bacterium]
MSLQITVSGMTCANCVRHVREALAGLPGVTDVAVDLASGHATIEADRDIDLAMLRATLEAEDYGMR